jgi:hypothetical protein
LKGHKRTGETHGHLYCLAKNSAIDCVVKKENFDIHFEIMIFISSVKAERINPHLEIVDY